MMNDLIPTTDAPIIRVRFVSPENAQKLSDYLPVRLRDFWLAMHPLAQAYLYDQSNSPEEFFVLVDMENARFTKMNMNYSRSSGKWYRTDPVSERTVAFKDIVPQESQEPKQLGSA